MTRSFPFMACVIHMLRPRHNLSLMSSRYSLRSLVLAAALGLVGVTGIPHLAGAQAAAPITMSSTRFEITQRLQQIDQQLALAGTKGKQRERLSDEATILRNRLTDGDFRVGERFMLTLIKDTIRTDSVTVRDSLLIGIWNLPDMSLKGVLRSELTARVSAFVAEFLLNTGVRTQILTRVSLMGEVGRPGFYYLIPDRPVSEAVTVAGGPTTKADIKRLEVTRAGKVILSAKKSEQAVKEGKTLEQLNIQSGDEIRIPAIRKFNWQIITQLLLLASSLFFALVNFLRFYYSQQSK